MSRLLISEYAAKKLLLGDQYEGVTIKSIDEIHSQELKPNTRYVIKVDDGSKRRMKKGLVKFSIDDIDALDSARQYLSRGFNRVLIEPQMDHRTDDEEYISFELVREGVQVLFSRSGGIDVEKYGHQLKKVIIKRSVFFSQTIPSIEGVNQKLVATIITAMRENNLSFVEINPYVPIDKNLLILDAFVEIDSSKLYKLPEWLADHVQNQNIKSESEKKISLLNSQSTASFSLTVFDKDASIFTLLSGGGASLVVLDSLVNCGLKSKIANYSEYSGAPSQQETKFYTDVILDLMFASIAKRKVLVIAGGVANFTDISVTLKGVVESCSERIREFKDHEVFVVVRRGGPRQQQGLQYIKSFFSSNGITAVVTDASVPLTKIAEDTLNFLRSDS